ncbi:MAG: mannose-1-phosphate guanylyltransferase, partial [Pseudomonadota bacterium]
MQNIHPVILSGGSGTRLWPLSRAMYPKQFISFFEEEGDNFLAATLERVSPTLGFAAPTLLCNNDHRFLVREQVDRKEIEPRAIILEPVARNTAAAIAVAALHVARENPQGILAVLPSDHMIRDPKAFHAAVTHAAKVAETGRLVMFGIAPSEPHTGYGYIKRGAALSGLKNGARKAAPSEVAEFTEKPDAKTAEAYLASGDYYWNSGIFVLHAQTFLDELGRLEPKILSAASDALAGAHQDFEFLRLGKAAFERSPSISVDYAVMER